MVTFKSLKETGWLHALFIAVIAHPLGNLAAWLGVMKFDAHPISYTAVTMLVTAIVLMATARPGPLGIETLKRPETWIYGVLNTFAYALAVGVALYATATEVSILTCIATVTIYLLSAVFLNHRVHLYEWLSLSLVFAAVILLLYKLEIDTPQLVQLSVLLVVYGLVQALQKIVVETHKVNRVAVTFHQNIRVTAIVMGVTSGMFVLLFLGLAYLQEASGVVLWSILPNTSDFANPSMYVLATLVGFALRAPSKYCEFYSTKKISAKYFTAVLTLQPAFTAFYVFLISKLGFIGEYPLTAGQFMALVMVMLGSLGLAFLGYQQKGKKSEGHFLLDPTINATIKQTVSLTLTFTHGNQAKAAKLLGVDQSMLKEILADKNQELQFTRDLVRLIQHNFAKNVAMADPLTGLQNRLQFTTTLTHALKQEKAVTVMLLDLNKFKPVNDTYGHEAGDIVLKEVAKRLQASLPKTATISRLGGDEFAVMLPNIQAGKTEQLVAKLKTAIAQPYKTRFGTIKVIASIGMATSPHGGTTADQILAAADKQMYANK